MNMSLRVIYTETIDWYQLEDEFKHVYKTIIDIDNFDFGRKLTKNDNYLIFSLENKARIALVNELSALLKEEPIMSPDAIELHNKILLFDLLKVNLPEAKQVLLHIYW